MLDLAAGSGQTMNRKPDGSPIGPGSPEQVDWPRCTVYNGFEGFLFPGGNGSNEVEVGMVKWLHLVGDYGQLSHSSIEWQPVPFDRCTNVDLELFERDLDRSESLTN